MNHTERTFNYVSFAANLSKAVVTWKTLNGILRLTDEDTEHETRHRPRK